MSYHEPTSWEVLYYESVRGDSPIENFLDGLLEKPRAKCLAYMDLLAEHGSMLPANFVKKVEGDLWELRPEFGGAEYRFLYFTMDATRIVIVHALSKKTRRLRRSDIDLAQNRIVEVRARLHGG